MNSLAKMLFVILLSGLAYYFSSGFGAIGWLMWLAPIPILYYAYSERYLKVALVAFIVGLASGINGIIGYWPTHFPFLVLAIGAIEQSLEWTAVILISSYFVKNCKHPISLLSYPVALSLLEWLESLSSQGTFNTIAYSQLHALPVMQIAAITGYFGVTFILSLFGSSLAYALAFYKTRSQAWLALSISLAIIIASISFGTYRIHQYNDSPSTKVSIGLASISIRPSKLLNPHLALSLLNEYQSLIQQLSAQDAKFVLLPEDTITVNSDNIGLIKNRLSHFANQYHVNLIIGVNEINGSQRFGTAWLFNSTGALVGTYHKEQLVPVIESDMSPGTQLLLFNIDKALAGVAICRDMDFSDPAYRYGQAGANILFVPAFDFIVDAKIQTAEPIMRGIENGYTVVRAAKDGMLSVTTPTGEVIAEKLATSHEGVILLANAPIWQNSSFYAQYGNWFAWVLMVMMLILIGMLIRSVFMRE
ncbi:MAG: nitrilase-related carbon-nitrogen hydrolase [Gammaproteobacteria bacterium]|nr:nitrilase-related carbon-nitrogen hydrolase [Gammaproteobacteria bacterium]